MCGFIITSKSIDPAELHDKNISLRGPDKTTFYQYKNIKTCHYLLNITGNITEQPFVNEEDEILAIYNGEIYNYTSLIDKSKSDGESIIPFYKRYGEFFTQKLDGEFALVLLDFSNNKLIISSDVFRTKPIFYAIENKTFGVASYPNSLKKLGYANIIEVPPNTSLHFDLNGNYLYSQKVFSFDVNNQDSKNVDLWFESFDNAIKKRILTDKKIFIGLSSGYDSGAICCSLLKQKAKFKTFSVIGTENNDVLNDRFKLLHDNKIESEIILKTQEEFDTAHTHIKQNTDPFTYSIRNKDMTYTEYIQLINDGGSNWLSAVCNRANKQNYKVILSGMGADEIISDYGFNGNKHYPHSNFGGKFPENLKDIFPWPSFYDSTMRSYLNKEEYVGGSYGIESRYPFLDKMVVQQFLYLHPSIKNACYKSVVSMYLEKNNFPFEKGVKRGF